MNRKRKKLKNEVITVDVGLDEVETVCNVCDAEFLDYEDLKIHITQIHLTETSKSRFCYYCSSLFADIEGLALHIRDKHLSSIKCCLYCTRAYIDDEKLRRHQFKHVSKKKGSFNCSQCPIIYNNLYELEQHELTHVDVEDGLMLHSIYPYLSTLINIKAPTFLQSLTIDSDYVCVICEYTDKSAIGYINHLKHNNCRGLACDNCSNVYKNKHNLKRHLSSKGCYNNLRNEDKERCPECHQYFTKYIFRTHLKSCRPIKCVVCDILFDSMYKLSEHQSKEHPLSVVVTKCKYCQKECVGMLNLQKHMDRYHKDDKHLYKYECIYCNQYFNHPKRLFAHFFFKHREVEPYKCKICKSRFRIRKKFTLHIKLDHNSLGRVEFDKSFHVIFTNAKPKRKDVGKNVTESCGTNKKQSDNNGSNEKQSENTSKEAINSDVLIEDTDLAQTEGNITEIDQTEVRLKRKRKITTKKQSPDNEQNISSDEEPLINIQKRCRVISVAKLRNATWNKKKRKVILKNKKKFTCDICKKYCYTFQNYHHHISLHYKNESKKCIKCSKHFPSEKQLNDHITKEHASSKLTETLKNMLEKRKLGIPTNTQPEITNAEKFQRTIRKVDFENVEVTAKLNSVEDDVLSVQKFIESFTPEETRKDPQVQIENSITLQEVYGVRRPPFIKMTKFQATPENANSKLRMPVKFAPSNETHTVSLKVVQKPIQYLDFSDSIQDYDKYEDTEKNGSIPEVAQEVMLEGTNEISNMPRKIVIPRLPQGFDDVRIAHLQREAPYYKIIKVNDMLLPIKKEITKEIKPNNIVLPDGTKLVNVNPLAHLIGEKQIDTLGTPHSKYYKPKKKNIEAAITKALLNLNANGSPRRRSVKKDVVVEQ